MSKKNTSADSTILPKASQACNGRQKLAQLSLNGMKTFEFDLAAVVVHMLSAFAEFGCLRRDIGVAVFQARPADRLQEIDLDLQHSVSTLNVAGHLTAATRLRAEELDVME